MSTESASGGSRGWSPTQVYVTATVCLLIGVALGYLFRGSESRPAGSTQAPRAAAPSAGVSANSPMQMPSLDDMKQMADAKAKPLLAQLQTDSNNSNLLIQVGDIYKSTHQFKEAVDFYNKALQAHPENVVVRTEMASCLFYSGDVDGAIGQLQASLHYDPRDANSLFNLGVIKWQGKKDAKGAVAAWRELLKSNPRLSTDRKTKVQKLIADVEKKASS